MPRILTPGIFGNRSPLERPAPPVTENAFAASPPQAGRGGDGFALTTVLKRLGRGNDFTIADAVTGIFSCGATGSGKSSAIVRAFLIAYMQAGMGGMLLCSKIEDCRDYLRFAQEAGALDRVVVIDASGKETFDPMQWEAGRASEGGGLAINLVHLLMELASADAHSGSGAGGDARFFEDTLRLFLTMLCQLAILSGEPVTLPRLKELAESAPGSPAELRSRDWLNTSACARLLARLAAEAPGMDARRQADLAQVFSYFTGRYPALSQRSRSITDIMAEVLWQPFLLYPLREIFTTGRSTVLPEHCFDGRIIIANLPVQEFSAVGRLGQLALQHCYQVAVMRRKLPPSGHVRPTFLVCDECQNYVTPFSATFQSVARSARNCSILLTQNRENLRRVLGDDDAVDSLLGNLTTKIFANNSSPATNAWASSLIGERWLEVSSRSVSQNLGRSLADESHLQGSSSTSWQKRAYVEPAAFAQLKRGGPAYDHQVSAIMYKGGALFEGDGGEAVPFTKLTFNQLK